MFRPRSSTLGNFPIISNSIHSHLNISRNSYHSVIPILSLSSAPSSTHSIVSNANHQPLIYPSLHTIRRSAPVTIHRHNFSAQSQSQQPTPASASQDDQESTEEEEEELEDEEEEVEDEEASGSGSEEAYETGSESEWIPGVDSDDEFTDSLSYDVRDDPYWDDLSEIQQRRYLYAQRHKNAEIWEDGKIPHAVKTSKFDYNTIQAVKRFPNLGKYGQRSLHRDKGLIRKLDQNVLNTRESVESGQYYFQPNERHLLRMLNKREISLYNNAKVDYSVRAGDIIKLELFTNLQKGKSQSIVALVLMARKKRSNGASIMIRNVEKDGLVVIRQYPLHSPWIKSLKRIKTFTVSRNRLYYMYNAPASVKDPVAYANKIGARGRKEFFRWLETDEGQSYLRDTKLRKRINFLGMRVRQNWAKRLAELYNSTAVATNIKGPLRNAKREMKYRLKENPYKMA